MASSLGEMSGCRIGRHCFLVANPQFVHCLLLAAHHKPQTVIMCNMKKAV